MFFPWRTEFRIGLCPDRLVADGEEHPSTDPLQDLRKLVANRRATVVLSNHFVRYAVLPWSDGLRSEEQWDALGKHTFDSIYGSRAGGWSILVSPAPARAPRVASAVDASILDSLRALPSVVSILPYLMSAFNALRRRVRWSGDAWFVLQEPRRMMVSLVGNGGWQLVRQVGIGADWQTSLPDILEREGLRSGRSNVQRVIVSAADRIPPRLGRFSLEDAMRDKWPRPAMALH